MTVVRSFDHRGGIRGSLLGAAAIPEGDVFREISLNWEIPSLEVFYANDGQRALEGPIYSSPEHPLSGLKLNPDIQDHPQHLQFPLPGSI